MIDFTKNALKLINNSDSNKNYNTDIYNFQKSLLDMQWKNNEIDIEYDGCNMIGMIDVSSSMEGDPLYAAISLGIKIAEKSLLGKRLMTFSSKPSWINLEQCEDFVSMVENIYASNCNLDADFYAALDMILESIIENKLSPESVQDLMLVILSDMQIDRDYSELNNKTFYENIKIKYANAGIKIWGKPFKPPHIVFWNLRYTNGFPCISDQMNCTMISGFEPSVLKLFNKKESKESKGFISTTPWSNLEKILNDERYKFLEEKYQ
jgi:hypothetical protein